MRAITRFVLRRAGLIALLGTALAVAGSYYCVLLYKNLRTDIQELLPTTARSVIDLDQVSSRLESIDNLGILVFSKNTKASRRFVDDLATRLNNAPKSLVASVEYRINKELEFFMDRRALYLELNDLTKVRDYIRDRIDYEKRIRNPLNIFSNENISEPTLDFRAMAKKYSSKVGAYSRFPDGYYATQDETKRAVLVYIGGKAMGIEQAHKLKNLVVSTVEELNPKTYSPDIEIHYTGGVQDMIEEQTALVEDLELSTIITVLIVSLAMVLFFKTINATLALLMSLFVGTLWTFGLSYFAVGYLNANSAFLGSIVIGNGINFGIIFLARYLEERRSGHGHVRSIFVTMTHTATATWTAALAAGLSYGSLILTGFRGFKQFGVIGLIGMMLCWIAAFTMLPAYLTVFDRIKPLVKPGAKQSKAYFSEKFAKFISLKPGLIWGISLIVTIASLAMLTRFTPAIIETNLGKLRSKQSMKDGSVYWSKTLDQIFQRYLSPQVLMPQDRADTLVIANKLRKIQEKQGPNGLISSVQTMDDFIPTDQLKKIEVMQEIHDLLPPRIMRRVSQDDQKIIREFLNDKVKTPIKIKDLPPLILSKFTEKDGSIGKLVLVEPPLTDSTWDGNNLINFVNTLRHTADSTAQNTPVAGSLPISSDMIESIMRDGPRATLFAFLAVVTLVILLFRNRKTISLILFSLFLGVTWLAGLIIAFNLKINFLNFIALPITFGIGVDYGVNIFQRYREEGSGSIMKVIRDTGGAVALASFTTIIGYGSLLIADNRAFVSFGILAVLGELTCIIAAIVSLPAFLLLRDRRRKRAAV